MYFIVQISYFILYKTYISLTICSTGENLKAVDVAGLNVQGMRFTMVLIAGVMEGVAGAFYSSGYLSMFKSYYYILVGMVRINQVFLY